MELLADLYDILCPFLAALFAQISLDEDEQLCAFVVFMLLDISFPLLVDVHQPFCKQAAILKYGGYCMLFC